MLDWHLYDDGFIAGGYRISLVGPRRWQASCDGSVLGDYRSLKTAFSTCEHHVREAFRRRAVVRYAVIAAMAFGAWFLVDAAVGLTGVGEVTVILVPVVFVGVAALVRCLAAAIGDVDSPFLPSHPQGSRFSSTKAEVGRPGD